MTVLILASFPSELGMLPQFRNAEPVFTEKQYRLFQSEIGGRTVRFGITGEGQGNVRKFFEVYFSRAGSHEPPDYLISTGFAGGLSESLRAGVAIAAGEVKELRTGKCFRADIPAFIQERFPVLCCLSVDRLYLSDAKEALARELPQADFIDMESAAVAEVCSARRIPYLVIRAVSDPVGFKFPSKEFVQDSWRRIPILKWALSLLVKPSDFFRTLAFQHNLGLSRKNIAAGINAVLKGLPGIG